MSQPPPKDQNYFDLRDDLEGRLDSKAGDIRSSLNDRLDGIDRAIALQTKVFTGYAGVSVIVAGFFFTALYNLNGLVVTQGGNLSAVTEELKAISAKIDGIDEKITADASDVIESTPTGVASGTGWVSLPGGLSIDGNRRILVPGNFKLDAQTPEEQQEITATIAEAHSLSQEDVYRWLELLPGFGSGNLVAAVGDPPPGVVIPKPLFNVMPLDVLVWSGLTAEQIRMFHSLPSDLKLGLNPDEGPIPTGWVLLLPLDGP